MASHSKAWHANEVGPYVADALNYCEDVISGHVSVCKWVQLACQRQLDDLNRTNWNYVFDCAAANKICAKIETLRHVKGVWAQRRETIKLQPWQLFTITTVFGWLVLTDEHDDDGHQVAVAGTRRFRVVYKEVPRKNAKSTESAGVALYMLEDDDEYGADVYTTATSRKQAGIVFNIARKMAIKDDGKLEVRAHSILENDSGGIMEPLHAEDTTMDGFNIHASINDEVHAWKDPKQYEVIETATGSRLQPLMWNITTAGYQTDGVCYELRDYAKKILQSVMSDDSFFCVIYTIDEDDDWKLESSWIKANPNWGVSVMPFDIRAKAKKAIAMPTARAGFKVKHLNIWLNAAEDWMEMPKWDKCADHKLSIDRFDGWSCKLGIDLSSKKDMAAVRAIFRDGDDMNSCHYYAFGKYFLPEFAIENSPNTQYEEWQKRGLLIATPGNIIDFDEIEEYVNELFSRFEVNEVAYDPYQATQFAKHMANEGAMMVEVRPTVLNFSEPMKEYEAIVIAGRFHHDGDPVQTWMVSNVIAFTDHKGNIYPRKPKNEARKIDGAVADIMAMSRWITAEEDDQPIVITI